MFGRIVLVFILFLAGYMLYGYMKRSLGFSRGKPLARKSKSDTDYQEMIKDPVCGTFVAPDKTLSVRANGRIFYFCSQDCMDKFNNRNY